MKLKTLAGERVIPIKHESECGGMKGWIDRTLTRNRPLCASDKRWLANSSCVYWDSEGICETHFYDSLISVRRWNRLKSWQRCDIMGMVASRVPAVEIGADFLYYEWANRMGFRLKLASAILVILFVGVMVDVNFS